MIRQYITLRNYFNKGYGEHSNLLSIMKAVAIFIVLFEVLGITIPFEIYVLLAFITGIYFLLFGWFWDKRKWYYCEQDWSYQKNRSAHKVQINRIEQLLKEMRKCNVQNANNT